PDPIAERSGLDDLYRYREFVRRWVVVQRKSIAEKSCHFFGRQTANRSCWYCAGNYLWRNKILVDRGLARQRHFLCQIDNMSRFMEEHVLQGIPVSRLNGYLPWRTCGGKDRPLL